MIKQKGKVLLLLLTTLLILDSVSGGMVESTLEDIKLFIYGISAGIAVLLLAIHGIRLKSATSPRERNEVKRSIIHVLLGLFLIIIAAGFVELIYKIPDNSSNNPGMVGIYSWFVASPSDNETGFKFLFNNTLGKDITNVIVVISCKNYDSCRDDDLKYTFRMVNKIDSGSSRGFSHKDFCENCKKFSIDVKSDQSYWVFCATCPDKPGGQCSVINNPC